MANDYTLPQFVDDLRSVAGGNDDVHDILKRVPAYAVRYAASGDIRRRCNREADAAQGFGFQLLHEEPDHSLAVGALSWLPGRGTPPHNHGTWAIVVGVEGDEVNVFYKRMDDGSRPGHAQLQELSTKTFSPGHALAMPPHIIHAVRNDSDKLTVSLHVYGRNINFTGRSKFDPAASTEEPFVVTINT
jgi:predicted metal-dependent enzyme (double-stranded beta helix superfamily)